MATDLVIILSSDWIGSTRARAQLGEDTADAVQEVHDTLLRRVIAAEGGSVVKHYGDGVMATFRSATAALAAAVRIQADFAAYRGSPDALTGLDVRVGLSAGDIKHQAGDIFGLPVVEAVRLQGAAAANEILCSDLVRVLSQGRGGFEFEDAGVRELKGLPEPVRAWKVRRPEAPAPRPSPAVPARPASRRTVPVLVAVLGLVAIAVLGYVAWRDDTRDEQASLQTTPRVGNPTVVTPPPTVPARLPNSVAVLPFENLSPDPDNAYFAAGLHEEVLNQLAKIRALNVIARTTMRQYENTNKTFRQIAEELNVGTVMEGSVRYAGNNIRVTAQLVDPETGAHLWSESYDHELQDIFAIQSDIALQVAETLKTEFSLAERAAIEQVPTTSSEAFEHYLRGQIHWAQGTRDGFRVAAEEFRRALGIDPNYARAWAELANSLSGIGSAQLEREEAAHRALEIAPDLPITLAAKMWVHADRGEWLPADEACAGVFTAARDPRAEFLCAGYLTRTGRVRVALPYREGAYRADPLSTVIANQTTQAYALLDMGEELMREYKRAQDLSGGWYGIEHTMLVHLMHTGSPPNVIAERLERMCAMPGAPPHCPDLLEATHSPGKAETVLRKLLDSVRETNRNACLDIALWAAYFGDRELALDALEDFVFDLKATSFIDWWFPLLSDVRRDPRFKAIVRHVGLVDMWRTTGQWADVCRPVGEDDFECE